MSESIKRPLAQMQAIAAGLVERLRPACRRIEIAGSIRRQKPEIGDIEIVAIPKYMTDLFGEPTAFSELDELMVDWPVVFKKNGQKYKQFVFTGKGGDIYTVDLFLPSVETWGCVYMIRTGSADFSRRMVTKQSMGGLMPNDLSVSDGRVWRNGATLDTPEEADVFKLWGMGFVEPKDRK
jgi:DNA polymerase/3'-5' exonuclease PolX